MIYDFEVTTIDGQRQSLELFRGQVLLIVNVASQCGFTAQYVGLEALYRRHHAQGFSVLGFPCDQFGHQEPGDEAAIKSFCVRKYDVTFPLFAKIDVNGPRADPLFKYLKSERPGLLRSQRIQWNFTKFLVDVSGRVVRRFAPITAPEQLEPEVRRLLS